ncbi:MAG: AraC family transcriptional regulator [Gordonia sp. (in: high G+C Gram-positive bacteria)]|uniref:AraC family transcriptional regulator n=1 Tax=Gordonia sp. (in: high G+C Gram-positive bacteria) TaxID=84139 RepID=UPI003C72A4DF
MSVAQRGRLNAAKSESEAEAMEHQDRTQDRETAQQAVANTYFPHELTVLGGDETVGLEMVSVDLGSVTIGRLSWGTDVAISCDYPGAFEVNVPLSGRLHSRSADGSELVAAPGRGTVFTAGSGADITTWSADCEVLGVKLDAEHLAAEADAIRRRRVRTGLALPQQIDVTAGAGAAWLQLVHSLSSPMCGPASPPLDPRVGARLASAVATALLVALDDADDGAGGPLTPRMVTRVLDAIEADPGHPWTLGEMAARSGTSIRRVQEGFAEYLGTTPSRALSDIRLERARDDLAAGVGTVADIAARWGFSNPSRFAAAFRRRYGVTPSQFRR